METDIAPLSRDWERPAGPDRTGAGDCRRDARRAAGTVLGGRVEKQYTEDCEGWFEEGRFEEEERRRVHPRLGQPRGVRTVLQGGGRFRREVRPVARGCPTDVDLRGHLYQIWQAH